MRFLAAPSFHDYDRRIDRRYDDHAVRYESAPPMLVEQVLALVAPYTGKRHARIERDDPAWHNPFAVIEGWAGQECLGALVNWNRALGYHTDRTGPPRASNVLLTLRDRCGGGLLVMPERRLAFGGAHGWLLAFDGRKVVHGVTALRPEPGGWRVSVAFYATT